MNAIWIIRNARSRLISSGKRRTLPIGLRLMQRTKKNIRFSMNSKRKRSIQGRFQEVNSEQPIMHKGITLMGKHPIS